MYVHLNQCDVNHCTYCNEAVKLKELKCHEDNGDDNTQYFSFCIKDEPPPTPELAALRLALRQVPPLNVVTETEEPPPSQHEEDHPLLLERGEPVSDLPPVPPYSPWTMSFVPATGDRGITPFDTAPFVPSAKPLTGVPPLIPLSELTPPHDLPPVECAKTHTTRVDSNQPRLPVAAIRTVNISASASSSSEELPLDLSCHSSRRKRATTTTTTTNTREGSTVGPVRTSVQLPVVVTIDPTQVASVTELYRIRVLGSNGVSTIVSLEAPPFVVVEGEIPSSPAPPSNLDSDQSPVVQGGVSSPFPPQSEAITAPSSCVISVADDASMNDNMSGEETGMDFYDEEDPLAGITPLLTCTVAMYDVRHRHRRAGWNLASWSRRSGHPACFVPLLLGQNPPAFPLGTPSNSIEQVNDDTESG